MDKRVNFVFLHVGEDIRPYFLVKSIKKFFPRASIYQCTDLTTKAIEGVDNVFRYKGDTSNLMTYRLEVFSKLAINEYAIYLDTDMLIFNHFNLDRYKEFDAVLCERSFNKDNLISIKKNKGIDLYEYEGKTLFDVYPYLACFTIAKSFHFWTECLNILMKLDKKFHYWYGDQEALRIIKVTNILNIGKVSESDYACLPEYVDINAMPYIVHFKNKRRKQMMLEVANKYLT